MPLWVSAGNAQKIMEVRYIVYSVIVSGILAEKGLTTTRVSYFCPNFRIINTIIGKMIFKVNRPSPRIYVHSIEGFYLSNGSSSSGLIIPGSRSITARGVYTDLNCNVSLSSITLTSLFCNNVYSLSSLFHWG